MFVNGETGVLKDNITPGVDYTHTFTSAQEVSSIKLTTSAQRAYVSSVIIETEASNTVVAPIITANGTEIAANTYIGAQEITLTSSTDGAAISYSTDNGETWISYAAPFTISETTTLQLKATKEGMTDSSVATVTVTILASIANTQETALTTAEAIALIENTLAEQLAAEKVYVKGTVSKVDSYNAKYKSITYWLDANAFQVYSGKGLNNTDFTSVNDVLVDAEVVVCGNLKKFVNSSSTTYEVDLNNYLVSYITPAGAKEVATITLNGNKTAMEIGEDDNEYTVTYDGDGELTIISSNEAVAEAIIVGTDVIVSAVSEGTTTITISALETDNYYAVEQKYTLIVSPALVAASLPFEFNGALSDISAANGIKQSGLGSYTTDLKLKFDDTNDELVIKFNATATNVKYDIKGNSFNNSTFDVKESADNQTYTTVATYTALSTTQNETKSLLSTTRYVKFVYTNKSTGNVALGNIKIYDSTPTAIDNATVAEKAVKMIEDGQLVIIREGVKYNAMGVRLQ